MEEDIKYKNIDSCLTYNSNLTDIFIPREIFQQLCDPYDKTNLFLMSFVRCCIYLTITKLYYDYINFKDSVILYIIFIFLILITLYNLILLLIVMLKRTKSFSFSVQDINRYNRYK